MLCLESILGMGFFKILKSEIRSGKVENRNPNIQKYFFLDLGAIKLADLAPALKGLKS